MADPRGIVAAGHPLTAEAGARVLREGGNAVDAALGALPGVVGRRAAADRSGRGRLPARRRGRATSPTLLDFFVAAPGEGADPATARRCCRSTSPSATRTRSSTSARPRRRARHARRASRRRPGAGAACRWRTSPRPPPRWRARACPSPPEQAYIFEILEPHPVHDARGARRLRARRPGAARRASASPRPSWPGRSSAWAPTAPRPSTPATSPRRPSRRSRPSGGLLTAADLAAYAAVARRPVRAGFRGREVLTNPPPSAGGILLALALGAPRPPPGAAVDGRPHRGHGGGPGRPRRGVRRGAGAGGLRGALPGRVAAGLDDAPLGPRRATAAPAA